ncbi:MAG: N-acetyltransferase [Sphingobacteriales bacterium]|nr:MAG: N-acetyltransferase [Sphingobacteriales bacterium]
MKPIIETERLILRELTQQDAPFILELVNTPGWLRYIGDRKVRTEADAALYILTGPLASYTKNGYGLWAMERRDEPGPIGLCGLIKREGLEHTDIGFALLPPFEGKGYAREAAQACIEFGLEKAGLQKIVAITSQDNTRSIALLQQSGFIFEKLIRLPGGEEELKLYGLRMGTAKAKG